MRYVNTLSGRPTVGLNDWAGLSLLINIQGSR